MSKIEGAPAPRRGRGLKRMQDTQPAMSCWGAPAPRRGRGLKQVFTVAGVYDIHGAPAPRRGRGLKPVDVVLITKHGKERPRLGAGED